MSLGELEEVGVPTFRLQVCDAGQVTYDGWNAAAAALIDKASSDIRGKTALEVFGGRFGRGEYERHLDVARHGKAIQYRQTLPTLEGERVFLTVLRPSQSDGALRWIYGTSIDVSDESAARREDALRLVALEEAERFITMAAHDLRAPMRNVGILAESLRDGFKDLGDGKLALLDHLDALCIRASGLISDVLAHARSVSAEPRLHEAIGLGDFAADIYRILDPLGVHDLKASDAQLMTDRPTFQIILRNLMENAIKHGGQRHLQLRISATNVRGMIALRVEDNGLGFTDPTLAFLDGGEFRYDSGFGLLGLRRLVEGRGGEISADHAAGGGSVVEVLLPGTVNPVGNIDPGLGQNQEVMS